MDHNSYLIDTNIFILLFNGRLKEDLPDGRFACSIITEMELLSFPSLLPEEEQLIRNRLAELIIYGIDPAVKEETIRIRRRYRLKLPDAVIAATALIHNAVLLTNDSDFQAIKELRCQKVAA